MEQNYVVGIDVGGQTSKIGVVDARGNILAQCVIRSDTYGNSAEAFIDALAEAVKGCIKEAGKEGEIRGIGVGAPNGNYYTGEIAYAPNLAWAAHTTVPFSKMLTEKMGGIPVTLTNDANAAAVGEMAYGAARGIKNFIMITLGTGVGGGIIIDGHLVYGHDGNAGELGHVTIKKDGRLCGCGKRGCLEAYCSATGVSRTAHEWLEATDEPSLLRGYEVISAKDVYDCAKKGDEMSKRIFDYTGKLLGEAIANFIAFSAPEAIVFFGGLARNKEFLLEPIQKAMNDNVMRLWKNKVKILFSALKESDAAILGASALAW